jgi:hypothetical protein
MIYMFVNSTCLYNNNNKKNPLFLSYNIILMKSKQYTGCTDWSDSWAHVPTPTHNPIISSAELLLIIILNMIKQFTCSGSYCNNNHSVKSSRETKTEIGYRSKNPTRNKQQTGINSKHLNEFTTINMFVKLYDMTGIGCLDLYVKLQIN